MMETKLEDLGWDSGFAETFRELDREGCVPGRVAQAQRGIYRVWTAAGEVRAGLSGRLRQDARTAADLPAVGDWVAVAPAAEGPLPVVAVLPRRTVFSREGAGHMAGQQVIAANVDTLLLVSGLDRDFNPRRIERSLVLAWESGAVPVVLLNKADACADPAPLVAAARAVAPGLPVHVVSARDGTGLQALDAYLVRGRTVALLGSSGVGKSTLVNRLVGHDVQATRAVRSRDGRGQHATTRRELVRLAGGALLVDTPGWRELRLFSDAAALDQAFADVAALAEACRFGDCAHDQEPGCAVRVGLEGARVASYQKLQAEVRAQAVRQDGRARSIENRRLRSIHRLAKRFRPRA